MALALHLCAPAAPNMNLPYAIANPHANGKWTGEYAKIDPELEFFDVYSPPITTVYGQVFWTMLPPAALPAEIVKRYNDKTMAITAMRRTR